jgi:hypothetical protein
MLFDYLIGEPEDHLADLVQQCTTAQRVGV